MNSLHRCEIAALASWYSDRSCVYADSSSSAYIKIREISPVAGEFRAPRIPTQRHRRYENTWREGKRQNTPRPPTRACMYSLGRMRSRSHTRVQDSYGATNDWNDLHSMSNRRSLSVFPRSSSFLRPFTSLFHRRSARRSSSRSGSLGLPSPREVRA